MIALIRTEFVKAVRRLRTLVMLGALAGLTTVITLAVHARNDRRPDRGEGLVRLARLSGLVVPAALLAIMSGFLLVIVAGMIVGDSVAGDASTGNLRYLLMRPVNRTKVVLAKAFVSGVLIWMATVVVAIAGLIAGALLFGWKPLDAPVTVTSTGLSVGFHLSTLTLIGRTAAAVAYVGFGFSGLLGIGVLVSSVTDTPAGAVSATVGAYIISEILDAITDLGSVRYALPTHYSSSWQTLFTENRWASDMWVGLGVQAAYLVVFLGVAIWWFNRKDIQC